MQRSHYFHNWPRQHLSLAPWSELEGSHLTDDWTDVLPSDPWTSAAIAVAVAAHDPLKDEADD